MESVQCGECGNQYDSDEHPFCPRCGSIGKSEAVQATATSITSRNHPRRRRAQMAGVILSVLGGLATVMFLAATIMASTLVPATLPTFEAQEGGQLTLNVDGGVAPEAQLASLNGTYLQSIPLQNGTATLQLPQAGVRVEIMDQNQTWSWNVLSLNQSQGHETLDANLAEPAGDHGWVGADLFVQGTRILGGIFTAVGVFTLLGGIHAIRLKYRGIATAGAIVGGLPWFIFFFVAPNVATGLILLSFVLSVAFIQGAKAHFTR